MEAGQEGPEGEKGGEAAEAKHLRRALRGCREESDARKRGLVPNVYADRKGNPLA